MREYQFELQMCAYLERDDTLIARQLGGGVHHARNRVLDIVTIEPGPEFEKRLRLTPETIPRAAIESSIGPGKARYWKDGFDDLELSSRHARRVTEQAIDVGFFELERSNGRDYVRQVIRYPDWFGRIRGIENKPDLDQAGDLDFQVRKDVELGLVDEVVVATESYVTRAHLNRLPNEVGVWRFDPVTNLLEVVRPPRQLPVTETGIEVLAKQLGVIDIQIASASAKARSRRWLAERAYGKGWRTYPSPSCSKLGSNQHNGTGGMSYCTWKEALVDPSRECGVDCPGYQLGDPVSHDVRGDRDRSSPWRAQPDGYRRTQSTLTQFM